MTDDEFVNKYIDLLINEFTIEEILETLCNKWDINYLYVVVKKKLVEYKKKVSRNALSRTNRRVIIKALDENVCQYCGSEVSYFEVDHITPMEDLGTDELGNLVTACHRCNRDKSDKNTVGVHEAVRARRQEKIMDKFEHLFNSKKGRFILKRFLEETGEEGD
jgi:5-methylcytosine-specific restriction endonuclease McrA